MIHETSSLKKSPLTIFSDASDDRPDPAAFLEWQQYLPTLTVRGKIDGDLYQVLAILKHLANLLK